MKQSLRRYSTATTTEIEPVLSFLIRVSALTMFHLSGVIYHMVMGAMVRIISVGSVRIYQRSIEPYENVFLFFFSCHSSIRRETVIPYF